VIVPDLNLLLYAYDRRSTHHEPASRWWADCLNGVEPVLVPSVVMFGFLRLATSARAFESPLSVTDAAECVQEWIERPHVVVVDAGADLFPRVVSLLLATGASGNLTTDAQIAAIAIENRATVFSNDSDFRRFPGLDLVNPLVA
jgi:toxin-antitoxin system PIN domain toxin